MHLYRPFPFLPRSISLHPGGPSRSSLFVVPSAQGRESIIKFFLNFRLLGRLLTLLGGSLLLLLGGGSALLGRLGLGRGPEGLEKC